MRRALLSVTDKQGISAFAKGLAEAGFSLLSTGGTRRRARVMQFCCKPVVFTSRTRYEKSYWLAIRREHMHRRPRRQLLDVAQQVEELALQQSCC